ncbi:MAG: GNAT family N-acetyltransferase [Candidatus Peribacteria bacterium]|nr:MAG: GNAT family N-acetyltransferase [Candidatus Peribacteria bacterium]
MKRTLINYVGTPIPRIKEIILENGGVLPIWSPALTEEVVTSILSELVDTAKLQIEWQYLLSSSTQIPGSSLRIINTSLSDYPNIMKLLGLIREWGFSNWGAGVGMDMDIDEWDYGMSHMLILNPQASCPVQMIVGAYRDLYHESPESYSIGSVSHFFELSDALKGCKLIELGRSIFNPYYGLHQHEGIKSNVLLSGLAYLLHIYPEAQGFFGKISVYDTYQITEADRLFYSFARSFWRPGEFRYASPKAEFAVLDEELSMADFTYLSEEPYKLLKVLFEDRFQIPVMPVMAFYAGVCDIRKMHYFGTANNEPFHANESGMLIFKQDLNVLAQRIMSRWK